MSERINTGLFPAVTGYQFVDPESRATLRGKNLPDLIAVVAHFRKINEFAAGNPEAEIHAYLAKHNPFARVSVKGTPRPTPPAQRLATAVLAWLNRLATVRKHQFVSNDEAARRMTACVACPENTDYAPACRGCNKTALNFRDVLLTGGPPVNSAVRGCSKYTWDNAVAARLPSGPSDPTAPAGCWRKPT